MPKAQKVVKQLNKLSVPYLSDDCCGEQTFLKEDTFTDKTSLTINHYLGKKNQFHVYDTDGVEISVSVTDTGNVATLDFGVTAISGTVTYWVNA